MCGIAGILFKGDHRNMTAGQALINMLDGCQHRGPDSTGYALYHEIKEGELRLRFLVGEGSEAVETVKLIKEKFVEWDATVIEEESIGASHTFSVHFEGDVQKFSYAMEDVAKLFSIGESLDIIKDIGSAHDVDRIYGVKGFDGTHGIGHVRLATESDVKPEAAHPFWATGFADVAIVHNGQLTNYWKMRRRLIKRGFEFHTDNDSELVAVYLADKLKLGHSLDEALKLSIDDFDGTFSFLVSTKDEIGYAKDRLACKPMVKFEDENIIAIASEEVSLNRLFPGMALNTMEPPPGTFQTWHR